MEQFEDNIQLDNMFGSFTYQVWILDSTDEWVLIYGNPLSEDEAVIYSHEAWSKLSFKKSISFQTYYDSHTGRQLFLFETEVPDSIAVRTSIQSYRPLSPLECDHIVLQVRYRLLQNYSNLHRKELDAWLQGMHSLTSMLDLNELLHSIMHNALISIPGVDRGFLSIFDSEIQKLVPVASVGLGPTIYEYKINIGEGIAGKVFQEQTGYIHNKKEGVEAISDLSEENYSSLMNALNFSEVGANYTIMAVPVRMNKEKCGVMVVHQFKKKRKLSIEDLHRLQGFADQAAIAITNARLFSELRKKNDYLMKRNKIHEVFTKLSLKDTDLVMVAKTVEQMIGLPVSLVDLTKNVWYPQNPSAPTIFSDTQFPDDWENRLSPLTFTRENETSFYLYPIVNEGMLIGYFVVEQLRPFKPLDTVILEQGSALVALKMVNIYSITELHYKRSYEFYRELLQSKEPNLLATKSKELGLSPEKPMFVAILQLSTKVQDVKKREVHIRRLIASLHKELGYSDNLLFSSDHKVTIILHAANESKQNSLIQKLNSAVNWWKNNNAPPLYGGIGRLYTGLEHVAKSNEEANKSLSYLLNRNHTGLMRYENIGINRLFLNQQNKEIEQFIQEVLSPLQEPKAQSSELELTLKTYIAANRSTSLSAERLHIHPNTLYHRIRKIEELLGVDLNEPNDWLTLLLACHLSETY